MKSRLANEKIVATANVKKLTMKDIGVITLLVYI